MVLEEKLKSVKSIRLEIESNDGNKVFALIKPEDVVQLKKFHHISPMEETLHMLIDELISTETKNGS